MLYSYIIGIYIYDGRKDSLEALFQKAWANSSNPKN